MLDQRVNEFSSMDVRHRICRAAAGHELIQSTNAGPSSLRPRHADIVARDEDAAGDGGV
jgi:hypothetical protein